MSNIMEKTASSFQSYLERNLRGDHFYVQELVEIASAPTKEDEDCLLCKKLTALQQDMKENSLKRDRIEGSLLQAMYLEMMSYSAPFAYIHAVKLLEQGTIKQKIIGYMAACTFLDSEHELVLLLVNTLQRDLSSNVSLIVLMALEVIPKLIRGEMTTAFQALVLEKTRHPSAIVRKAATVALHHCYVQSGVGTVPSLMLPALEKPLGDSDIRVVSSSVHCIHSCAENTVCDPSHLYPALEKVYMQLQQRTVSPEYEFNGIAMPWLQICILATMKHSRAKAEHNDLISDMVHKTLASTELSQIIYYAIILEAVNTVANIMNDNAALVSSSIACISKLLRSQSANLSYCGVDALEQTLSQCCPSEAIKCQEVIIDCLHHPDESIRIKTLNLLVTMANRKNVGIIANRIMKFLATTTDVCVRLTIVQKVLHLLRQYPENLRWSAETFASLLFTVADLISEDDVLSFISTFKQDSDGSLHLHSTVSDYCKEHLVSAPHSALQFAIWVQPVCCLHNCVMSPSVCKNRTPCGLQVLGEAHDPAHQSSEKSQAILLKLLGSHSDHASLCLNALGALMKILLTSKQPITDEEEVLSHLINKSTTFVVQQRTRELVSLNLELESRKVHVLCIAQGNGQVDSTLSFLDGYVCSALKNGAAPYKPKILRQVPTKAFPEEQLVYSDIETVGKTMTSSVGSTAGSSVSSAAYQYLDSSSIASSESDGKQKLWSAEGRKRHSRESARHRVQDQSGLENPKMEDMELMKSLFRVSSLMEPTVSIPTGESAAKNSNMAASEALRETTVLQQPGDLRYDELRNINVKKENDAS